MIADEKLIIEVDSLGNNFDAVHKRQKEKRKAFLEATENSECVKEMQLAMQIASELFNLRKQANMTQKELAERMHTNQATIAKIERGRDLKVSTIERFVSALGKHIDIRIA
jgi:HTH-type transcriptional regulator / antitoxin HipB